MKKKDLQVLFNLYYNDSTQNFVDLTDEQYEMLSKEIEQKYVEHNRAQSHTPKDFFKGILKSVTGSLMNFGMMLNSSLGYDINPDHFYYRKKDQFIKDYIKEPDQNSIIRKYYDKKMNKTQKVEVVKEIVK